MCEGNSVEYLRDLIKEREGVTSDLTRKLLDREISRIQDGGRPPGGEIPHLDVYNEKSVRVSVKVVIPVREHPKFNFVGKLLGPRGSSLKQLQEVTRTKMAVLGKGSMKNKQQEEELHNSLDPKHSHLKEDLHLEIIAFAPPSEAYARIAMGLREVRKYLIPDSNDQIRQKQMWEIRKMKRLHSPDTFEKDCNEESHNIFKKDISVPKDISNNNRGSKFDLIEDNIINEEKYFPKSQNKTYSSLDKLLQSQDEKYRREEFNNSPPICFCHSNKRGSTEAEDEENNKKIKRF